jgi:AbrB family looped-hinge helix DNA binding protein
MADRVEMKSGVMDKRGRITVPREVRQLLGLAAGDQVEFVVEGDRIIFRAATNPFSKWIGVCGKFPGGEKGIAKWIRDMRDEED